MPRNPFDAGCGSCGGLISPEFEESEPESKPNLCLGCIANDIRITELLTQIDRVHGWLREQEEKAHSLPLGADHMGYGIPSDCPEFNVRMWAVRDLRRAMGIPEPEARPKDLVAERDAVSCLRAVIGYCENSMGVDLSAYKPSDAERAVNERAVNELHEWHEQALSKAVNRVRRAEEERDKAREELEEARKRAISLQRLVLLLDLPRKVE